MVIDVPSPGEFRRPYVVADGHGKAIAQDLMNATIDVEAVYVAMVYPPGEHHLEGPADAHDNH